METKLNWCCFRSDLPCFLLDDFDLFDDTSKKDGFSVNGFEVVVNGVEGCSIFENGKLLFVVMTDAKMD